MGMNGLTQKELFGGRSNGASNGGENEVVGWVRRVGLTEHERKELKGFVGVTGASVG